MNNYNDWPEMAELENELEKTRRIVKKGIFWCGLLIGFTICMIVFLGYYYSIHATH